MDTAEPEDAGADRTGGRGVLQALPADENDGGGPVPIHRPADRPGGHRAAGGGTAGGDGRGAFDPAAEQPPVFGRAGLRQRSGAFGDQHLHGLRRGERAAVCVDSGAAHRPDRHEAEPQRGGGHDDAASVSACGFFQGLQRGRAVKPRTVHKRAVQPARQHGAVHGADLAVFSRLYRADLRLRAGARCSGPDRHGADAARHRCAGAGTDAYQPAADGAGRQGERHELPAHLRHPEDPAFRRGKTRLRPLGQGLRQGSGASV